MNYVFDYIIRNNTNYAYTNVCNMYNFIYDVINLNDDEDHKNKIMLLVRKNLGNKIYDDMRAYFIRKAMN